MESEVVSLLRDRGVDVQSCTWDSTGRQLLHCLEKNSEVSVVITTFNTSASWKAAKDYLPTAFVHSHLVEYRRTLDFKVAGDCWVLADVYESMTRTLENEIEDRRDRRAPWTAQELVTILKQLATLLSSLQSKGHCLVDLPPKDVYVCNGRIKLPQYRWVAIGPNDSSTLKSSVLSLGTTVLAMAALNPDLQDLRTALSALQHPKWLKYFISKMLGTIPQLRPDFLTLIFILETSKYSPCRHCTSRFESHEGCAMCGRFCCLLCSQCADQRTPLCRDCKGRFQQNPKLLSLARTPEGTDRCERCRQLKDADSLVLVDDGVQGRFCVACAQEELDGYELKLRCRSSWRCFFLQSILHAL